MKILILNDLAAPHGGAEQITLSLRDGLRTRGHDARVLASSAHSDSGRNEAEYSCFGTTGGFRTLNRVANPSAYWNLRRVLREFEPDLVHVRMFLTQLSPLILPLLHDTPALYHATWHEAVCPTGLKLLPNRKLCNHPFGVDCYRNHCLSARAWGPLMLHMQLWRRWRGAFDMTVSNSDAIRARLLEAGIAPVETVWNGVPEVPIRPPLRSPPTITCAGRLTWEKGLDVLIRAFVAVVKQHPQARLIVAGTGPDEKALRGLAADSGVAAKVHFVGQLAHRDMEKLFATGWVHAVPSLCAEGFGMSAAEASMRGTAVVGSRHGGIAEIVADGETGLLVPPDDEIALAAALLRILSDRKEAERMGRNGRARAERFFGREAWIERFLGIYRRMLEATADEAHP